MNKIITLTENEMNNIIREVNSKGSGYNGAWLDGYTYLAKELNIVKWDYASNKYVIVETTKGETK